MREGNPETLSVTLGRRELAEGTSSGEEGGPADSSGSSEVLGMSLAPLTPEVAAELGLSRDATGLVINEVNPESAAAEKGLAPGDVITEMGQQPVATVADLDSRIDEAREAGRKSVLVLIRRAGEPRFVALPVGEE